MNPEQHSPEQRQKEAVPTERRRGELEQGDVELSINNLRQVTEGLRTRAEAAELQRERDTEKKVSELELLRAEAKRINELFVKARGDLEYFTAMQEFGQLSKADQEELGKLQELISLIENQREEIEKKIAAIPLPPHSKILEKLHDAAKKEDVEITIGSLVEQSHAELDPQIDQVAGAIENLASRDNSLWQSIKQQELMVSSAWKRIGEIFNRAKDMLREKSDFGYTLEQILRGSRSLEELSQKLTEAKRSLRVYKGKEKAAVDFILNQTQVFDEYRGATKQLSSLGQQRESLSGKRDGLSEQFRTILGKAWEVEDKISKLGGTPLGIKLPTDLWHRLQRQVEKLADLQRWEGGRQVGKHKDWFNAMRTPEGRTLYDTWEYVTETAGGYGLTASNPNKNRAEQENQE